MHRPVRVLALACTLAAVMLIMGAPAASAHAQRQAGPIHMEIGFGTEPAYVGQPNSAQIILTEHGQPVVDLRGSLKVQVSFGGQQTDISLQADFEVGGDGTPGDYRAWFIPSQPGPYTFHLTGTVHGTKIDESITSGPKTFDVVQDPAEAAFWTGWIGWTRLHDNGFPRVPRAGAYGLLGIAGVLVVTSAFVPRALLGPKTSTRPRPSSTATIAFLRPREHERVSGSEMNVVLDLRGGTIVQATTTSIAPGTGHVHLLLDGSLVSMTFGTEQVVDLTGVPAGPHTMTAEFV